MIFIATLDQKNMSNNVSARVDFCAIGDQLETLDIQLTPTDDRSSEQEQEDEDDNNALFQTRKRGLEESEQESTTIMQDKKRQAIDQNVSANFVIIVSITEDGLANYFGKETKDLSKTDKFIVDTLKNGDMDACVQILGVLEWKMSMSDNFDHEEALNYKNLLQKELSDSCDEYSLDDINNWTTMNGIEVFTKTQETHCIVLCHTNWC